MCRDVFVADRPADRGILTRVIFGLGGSERLGVANGNQEQQ